MKKFLLFLFLFLGFSCLYAQYKGIYNNTDTQQNAVEDIDDKPTISYNVKFTLKQDDSVVVVEKFIFDWDRQETLPRFKRIIKTDKKLQNISLYFNNRLIDVSVNTDEENEITSVFADFVVFLYPGKNTLLFTYTIPKAIYSLVTSDHFKWDLDLEHLPYPAQQGMVIFKTEAALKSGKIIFKHPQAEATFDIRENFDFPITTAFKKHLKVILDLSFEQGFFESTSTTSHLLNAGLTSLLKGIFRIAPVCVVFIMIFYSFILWYKYGKDPTGPFVTEYAPPKEITPAFAKFLLNRKVPLDFSYFIITLLNLSLNKYIEITSYKGQVCIKSLRGPDSSGLVEEDKIIYDSLFAYSPTIVLNKENAPYVSNAIMAMFHRIIAKGENYFTPNYWYAAVPATMMMASFLLLFAFKGVMLVLAAFCFVICLVIFVIFMILIDNVSPRYKAIYCKIMGFRQYMKIAEEGRVHFSDPLDKERLFCDYLAYAYAFAMEQRIIRQIRYRFDGSAIAAYLNTYVNVDFLSLDYMIDAISFFAQIGTKDRKRRDPLKGIRY